MDSTEKETKTEMDSTEKETKTEMDSSEKEIETETDPTEKETNAETDPTEKETKNDSSEETELLSLVSLLHSSLSSREERLSSLTSSIIYVRGLAEKQRQARSVTVRSLTDLQ